MMRSTVLLCVLAAPMGWGQTAPVLQTRPDAPLPGAGAIKVTPRTVMLTVTVRGRKGELVTGLTKDDFVLKAGPRSIRDAKPDEIQAQTISYFESGGVVPLTLGLLVDVGRAQRDALPGEKTAVNAFLEKALQPAVGTVGDKSYRAPDKAFVVQFAKPIEMLHDVTDKTASLKTAVDELGTESATFKNASDVDTVDSEGRRVRNGGTSLYDTIYLSANEIAAKQKGRKVLVLLTDGVDVGSRESLGDAIEAAQKSDTVIYAVYSRGVQQAQPQQRAGIPGLGRPSVGFPGGGGGYPGGYPNGGQQPGGQQPGTPPQGKTEPSRKPNVDGRQVLDRICGETGGMVFEVSKRMPVDAILQQIAEELRTPYLLGFTPTPDEARYGYHQIDMSLKDAEANKRDSIEVRDGYYASDPE